MPPPLPKTFTDLTLSQRLTKLAAYADRLEDEALDCAGAGDLREAARLKRDADALRDLATTMRARATAETGRYDAAPGRIGGGK